MRCRFGWFDGVRGHICHEFGEHDKHACEYCGAMHDPGLRLPTEDALNRVRLTVFQKDNLRDETIPDGVGPDRSPA